METKNVLREYQTPISIVLAGVLIAAAVYASQSQRNGPPAAAQSDLQELVTPSSGVALPIVWGDLGVRLVASGTIDPDALKRLYQERSELPGEYDDLFTGRSSTPLKITRANAGRLLNLLWAVGLANKNPILEDKMEMMNPAYGGAGNFASTGGWTIAKGDPMNHYGKHALIALTPQQQELVDRVSRGIYRPCCGNSTHFPDCNHGMAMLGLLQMMASQGVSEQDMYNAALAVNAYWFPDTYDVIAAHLQQKGVDWRQVPAQKILGADYSSATGFQNILSQVDAPSGSGGGGGGCSV